MDKDTVRYITHYFSNLMTDDENLAMRHHMYTYKMDNASSDSPNLKKFLTERGLISSDEKILEFLKNGYDEFKLNVVKRIMTESYEKIFFNNCPKCNKLARTPYAKQCRSCGYNWHHLVVAQFKLDSSFQLMNRHFFLTGQITRGVIKEGNFMDLAILGLYKKPKIEVIESALQRRNGSTWENVALGTHELTGEDKAYIIGKGSYGMPFDILSER